MVVQAWKKLSSGALNSAHGDTINILTRLPDLNLDDDVTYDFADVFEALNLTVEAIKQDPMLASQDTFR